MKKPSNVKTEDILKEEENNIKKPILNNEKDESLNGSEILNEDSKKIRYTKKCQYIYRMV